MADQNLKDFLIGWMQMGLLLVCLVTFTAIFMAENNPIGLDDGTGDILNKTLVEVSSDIYLLPSTSDLVLNTSAETDPEVSDLGSRDSVSTAYKFYNSSKSAFTQMKELTAWVFSGTLGEMLEMILVGAMGFLGVYFLTKWIRNGW